MTLFFKEFPFLPATASELLCNETGNISVINVKTAVLPWNREVMGEGTLAKIPVPPCDTGKFLT